MANFPNENFISWVAYMFAENCKERKDYGDKLYPSAEAYLKKNRAYLEREYKSQNK